MSDLCSHRRGRGFRTFSFAALVFIITGLVLAVLYPVSASPPPSFPSLPKQQGEWPAVGVGAGYMRFEHLGIQEGLSDNAVLAVLQDSLGFMWFGTREGLNRYDGYEFTVYSAELDGPNSLSDSTVTALAETSSGTLWVGTQDGGLNRFDTKTRSFTQINLKNDSESITNTQVNVLQVDSLGRLWIATPEGLRRLDLENGSVSIFQSDPGDAGSLSDDDILSLFEDEAGRLWIGTANGLNLYENNNSFTRYLTDVASDVSSITAISSDGEGGLWLGSQGGLLHFDPERESTRVFRHNPNAPDYLSSNRISALFRDSSGRLWIGYEDQGIDLVTEYTGNEISVESFEHQSFDPQSLSHNAVRAISEDEGGLLWFGTHGGGVNKANPATRTFGYYLSDPDNANSPAGGNVTALAFDASRRSLWIGTADNGLDQMNLITGEFKHYQHDPEDINSLDSDQVTLLHIGPQGNLFVETQAGVLEYYDPAVDGFLPALTNLTGYRSGSHITAITHDSQGTLWLSQSSRQLIRVEPDSEVVIRYDLASYASEPIQDLLITDIHADPAGILWLGTDNLGLVRFDQNQGTFTILSTRGDGSGPSHDTLTNIYPGRDGVLWLGTEGGGLNKYEVDTGEFTYFTIEDGLPSNRVYGILEDGLGNLWLSTGNGLVRFDPVTGSIEKFDVSDGLQGNTFNPHAYAAGNRGALFFGGVEGFNAFYPAMIEKNDHIPPVVITEVSLFNRILARNITGCDASLSLTHDQNFLSFEFTALDFASPDNNQYAYRMDGLDEDFVQSGNKRSADYPDLAWGTYTFRLIGSNNDGLWNTEETCLLIDIQAPFWARWWFILLVGLFLAAAVVLGYQWRIRAMEKNRENLAIQVFERTLEIERRRQMASGLSEVIRLINTNQPLGKSLDYIVHQCVGLTSAEKAAIFERVGDQVVARACYPQGETYPVDLTDLESSSARCLLETTLLNRLLIISRLDPETMKSDTSWELVSGDYRTVLCTPVLVEDEVELAIKLSMLGNGQRHQATALEGVGQHHL